MKSVSMQWGGEIRYSNNNEQSSRGVMVGFDRRFDGRKIGQTFSFDNGNLLLQEFSHGGRSFLLVSLYGPNEDSPEFYDSVKTAISKFIDGNAVDFLILQADWNLTVDPEKDTIGYQQVNNPRAMGKLRLLMEEFDLHDVWRMFNPDTRRYTYRQKNQRALVQDGSPEYKQSRLDFFLISGNLLPFVKTCSINYGYRTDHSSISMSIDLLGFKKGRGLWKFNARLLRDQMFIEKCSEAIKNTQREYLCTPYDSNYFENADLNSRQTMQYKISDDTLFEMILMSCRNTAISYAAFRKKHMNQQEETLVKDIAAAETDFSETNDPEAAQHLQAMKTELEQIREEKLEGAKVRSRGHWALEGERPTAYFCGLESRNFSEKFIPRLRTQDGFVSKQQDILNATADHFTKLFHSNACEDDGKIKVFLGEALKDLPQLSEEESMSIEGPVSYEEVTKYVGTKLKGGKSPGSTGFTGEFYKAFWPQLGRHAVNAMNYAYEIGKMPVVQRQGLITLIPKPDRDLSTMKGYRPISLLNTWYKILSGVIAERIKKFLPKLIHPDQGGFVEGRYIGDVIRNTLDILHDAKLNKKHALLLSVDVESAFDRLRHDAVKETMELFNFGPTIRNWIRLFLTDLFSNVTMCGFLSKSIQVLRSARQGDPLGPYVFILCLEIFATKVRHHKNIVGYKCDEQEQKLSLLADDCTFYLEGNKQIIEGSIVSIYSILDDFHEVSGLNASIAKSKAMWIGAAIGSDPICPNLKFSWCNSMKLLGVTFDNCLADLDINFEEKFTDIKKLLARWRRRSLTVIGKIVVWKTLALSKLTYVALMLPFLSQDRAKRINDEMLNFIWDGGSAKIAKKIMEKPTKDGGLNLPNINTFFEGLKIGWIKRLEFSKCFWKKLLLKDLQLQNVQYDLMFKYGNEYSTKIAERMTNPFWAEVFYNFSHWALKAQRVYHWRKSPIWFNSDIVRGGAVLKPTEMLDYGDAGITEVGELFDDHDAPLKFDDLCRSRNVRNSPLNRINFYGLIGAIQRSKIHQYRSEDVGIEEGARPQHTVISCFIFSRTRGCGIFRNVEKKYNTLFEPKTPVIERWHKRLNSTITDSGWKKIFTIHRRSGLESKFQWFQIRIIQNILGTNKRMNVVWPAEFPTPLCTFCDLEPESILHLFNECPCVAEVWRKLQLWLREKIDESLVLTRLMKLFGATFEEATHPLNVCLLVSRFFIWYCRCAKTEPSFQPLLKYLSFYIKSIRASYYLRGKGEAFLSNWSRFLQWLE